jgi:hypothetical protein
MEYNRHEAGICIATAIGMTGSACVDSTVD